MYHLKIGTIYTHVCVCICDSVFLSSVLSVLLPCLQLHDLKIVKKIWLAGWNYHSHFCYCRTGRQTRESDVLEELASPALETGSDKTKGSRSTPLLSTHTPAKPGRHTSTGFLLPAWTRFWNLPTLSASP